MKQKSWDLIINIPEKNSIIRKTKKYEEIDKLNIDENKIILSIRANWVHYTDAILIRDINKDMKQCFITIHDCFLVDALNVSRFIFSANKCINKVIFEDKTWNKNKKKEFFSIFLFI
jgi:hypothetical protein